jgi:protein-S-isoprenylcysteine O-methyltransferase Ste14
MTRFERLFVWAGGAAFVLSLAVTAWWYFSRLGVPAAFGGWSAVTIDGLLFSAFALHHSLFARPSSKALLERVVPRSLIRATYVWAASVLLVLVCLFWQRAGGTIYRITLPWLALNAAVQLVGFILIARAVHTIDALELAGIRRGDQQSQALQITGPYHLVRHPLYLGWMLVVFGIAHMTADRLLFAALSSLYLIVAVPWEERSLERDFGDAYRRYKKEVRWRILPYLY